MRSVRIAAALVLALAACTKEVPRVQQGRAVYKGFVKELYAAPGGRYVATLADAEPSNTPGAPQDLVLGALVLGDVQAGSSRRLGGGVANLPGSLLFSPDGAHVAFVASYSVTRAQGELRLAKTAGGEVETIANPVTFFTFSPAGDALAYVNDGRLYLKTLAGGEPVQVTDGVSYVEFAPGSSAATGRMLVKRSVRTGGKLLAYDLSTKKLSAVAREVGSFGFAPQGAAFVFRAEGLVQPAAIEAESKFDAPKKRAPMEEAAGFYLADGEAAPRRLATEQIGEFRFSADGRRFAYTTQPQGGQATGDLYVVEGGGDPQKIASRVYQFMFGPDGSLALLGAFEPASGVGTLGLLPAGGKLVEVARTVKQFQFSKAGRHLLFSKAVTRANQYSIALAIQRVDAAGTEKPRYLDTGVYGYVADAKDELLAYKARCLDAARACSLFVTELDRPAGADVGAADAGTKEERYTGAADPAATRVAAFEWIPGERELMVVTSRRAGKHTGNLLFALGTVRAEPNAGVTLIDDQVTGDFVLAGPDRKQVAYLVMEKGREGLYVAGTGGAPAASR